MKEATEAMDEVMETTEAAEETVEAAEEVTAATANTASCREARGASSCFDSLLLVYRQVQPRDAMTR